MLRSPVCTSVALQIGEEAVTVTWLDGVLRSHSPRRSGRTSPVHHAAARGDPTRARYWRLVRRGGSADGEDGGRREAGLGPFLQGKRVLLVTNSNTHMNETVTRVLDLARR